MNGVINNKNADVVLNKLREEIPKNLLNYSDELKITYIPGEVVRNRMDEVLGNNYTTKYDAQIILIPDIEGRQRPYIKSECTITVLDDDGKVLLTRSGIGGSKVIQVKDSGAVKNIGNDMDSACIDAFKRCCKEFGISSPYVGKGNRLNATGHRAVTESKTECRVYQICYISDFSPKGRKGYSANVKVGDTEYELVVWDDAASIMSTRLGNEWFKRGYSGKSGQIKASEGSYQGKRQLIFADFVS